ncbi:late embryogenesis abundant hydroxyproline-rich glycoprotein [Corchorus olitorius]|uniref:Late embryogenesis abundant hydroxyproline-rich glycoprotein n=1 Tax=Corchorus olitorius TaxID=93759 RepID=A0A1R3H302_9ROSI|nr:late embryogenesis abundant hydroxyproline-rich glycoprotein [Corchorus olitorius]
MVMLFSDDQEVSYPCRDKVPTGHEKRSVRFALDVDCRNPIPHLAPVPVISRGTVIGYPMIGYPSRYPIVNNIRRRSDETKCQSCLIISSLVFAVVAFAAFVCLIPIINFYLFGPCSPDFHVEQVNLHYPIFYTGPTKYASLLNVTMKVQNPSKTFHTLYERDNIIVASYSEIPLSNGMIPPFQLSPLGATVVEARLEGLGIDVPEGEVMRLNLQYDHQRKRVPLSFDITGMVKFKLGSRTIWSAVVKAYCDLELENLDHVDHPPRIMSQRCDSQAGFWFPMIRN